MKNKKKYNFILVILISILLTAYFFLGQIKNLNTFYPSGDAAFSAWTMETNFKAFINGKIAVFDPKIANQFYPYPYAFNYSEHLFLPSLLIYSPIALITKNHIISTNLTIIFTFFITFLSAFFCLNKLIKNSWAAIIGAIIFTYSPIMMSHYPGHTQLLFRFFIPPIFLYLLFFLKKLKVRDFLLFLLFFLLNALTSVYFMILAFILIFVVTVSYLIINRAETFNFKYQKKIWLISSLCIAIIPIIIGFYKPYFDFSLKESVKWNINSQVYFSTQIQDYLFGSPNNFVLGKFYKNLNFINFKNCSDINYADHWFFFGFVEIGTIIYLFFSLKKYQKQQKIILLCFLIVIFSFIWSFGPYLSIKNVQMKLPFYYFFKFLPFLAGIRVQSRIWLVGLFFVAFLVGNILKNIKKSLIIIIFIFLLFEYKENYVFLKLYQSNNFNFPNKSRLAYLPIHVEKLENENYFDMNYISFSLNKNARVINGYSSFFPLDYKISGKFINSNIFTLNWLKYLKALDITHVVIDKSFYKKINDDQNYINNGKKYLVFENSDWAIVDIRKLSLPNFCVNNKKTNLKIKLSSVNKENYTFKISNISDCYIRNFYENRYLEINNYLKKNIRKKYYLKFPPVIFPKQTLFQEITVN